MPKPYFNNKQDIINSILRVNHAGEYGAIRIYKGQLKSVTSDKDYNLINHMLRQEEVHFDYFNNIMIKKKIRPTILMPIWHYGGYAIGFISSFLGGKYAMTVTEAVEEVIDEHYNNQIIALNNDDLSEDNNDLINNIIKFQSEEIEHKNIAEEYQNYKHNFISSVLYSFTQKICKISILLSKKI